MDKVEYLYDENGCLKSKIVKKTERIEQETEYYPNGQVKASAEYLDNVLHGSYKEFDSNGILREHSTWVNGRKWGMCATFFENGRLECLENLIGPESFEGIRLLFYPNGIVKEQATYKDGIEHGPFITRNKNGLVSEEGSYYYGELDGEYRIYYKNGQLREKIDLYQGKRDGEYVAYYPNGQIKKQIEYIDDMKDGDYCAYCEDGTPIVQMTYKHDYRVGSYRKFYPNGQVKLSAEYTQDIPSELHGDLRCYSESGQLLYIAKYDHGDKIVSIGWDQKETNEQMEQRADALFEKTMLQIYEDEAQPRKITSHVTGQNISDCENTRK